VIPTSSIFLNVPGPLSINILVLSEIMINPGDALLIEGMPVPEPNTITSANAFTPIENALNKTIMK
jgi:hypothetical protein